MCFYVYSGTPYVYKCKYKIMYIMHYLSAYYSPILCVYLIDALWQEMSVLLIMMIL